MNKETLVLLPGMMCDARLFAPQVTALAPEHDVVIGDLTGSDTIEGMAAQIIADVQAPRFNLAGLSMGGIVAMEIVRQAPARVLRLGLIDTNHHADAVEKAPVRQRQICDVRAGGLRDVIVEEMKPVYLAEQNRRNEALLKLLTQMAMGLGEDAFVSQSLALLNRPDQSATLGAFRGPALVLCGAEDCLCPPDRHREMAGLLQFSELKIIEAAGHISTLEQPTAVNAALRQWLKRPPTDLRRGVVP
jgi:pimeloyl-ACP methyl ester carboxylesterase